MALPRTSTSTSSSLRDETELLPLSSSSSSNGRVRGAGSLPPPLPTPPSPSSFFKAIRKKAAEAAAAAVSASASSSGGSSGGKGLPTSTSTLTPASSTRERERRRKLLAVVAAALLIISLGSLFSFEILLTEESEKAGEQKKVFGQKTAKFVHRKTIAPASEAAAVASLKVRTVAAAAASRASASLSATATTLLSYSPSSSLKATTTATAAAAAGDAKKASSLSEVAEHQQQQQSHPTRSQSRFPLSTRPLTAFVGVQSRPVTPRRQALRDTWFPSNSEEREKLMTPSQSASSSVSAAASPSSPLLKHRGIAFRFVVGLSAEPSENLLVEEEARQHDDVLILENVRESYDNLVLKTVAFFSAAADAFPGASFIIKLDDDVYVRPDNLALIADQWEEAKRDYVGCLMKGGEAFDDKRSVYYEPLNALLPNKKYYGYMSGSAYALSRRAALLLRSRTTAAAKEGEKSSAAAAGSGSGVNGGENGGESSDSGVLRGPLGGLRPMACEDCAVGLWLLAHDVRHGEDLRMCRYDREVDVEEEAVAAAGGGEKARATTRRKRHSCADSSRASAAAAPVVVTNRCNGLCDPMQSLVDLHSDPSCRAPTIGVVEEGKGGEGSASASASASAALPLGDFWSSNSMLSREEAIDLECIKVTADGNIDRSACKEGVVENRDGGR